MVEQEPAPGPGSGPSTKPRGGDRAGQVCVLCGAPAVGQLPLDPLLGPAGELHAAVVAYLDDDLVALVAPGTPGVLVAPRHHVEGLATTPTAGAVVLGALRRAASTVACSYAADGTVIEATTDLPGAPGHVCYRIVPTRQDQALLPGDHPAVDPDLLALAIRRSPTSEKPAPG